MERGLLQLWKAGFVGKVLFTLDKGFFQPRALQL